MPSPFATFVAASENVAHTWPNAHPKVAEESPEHHRYALVGDIVMDTIAAAEPSLPDKLTGLGARHGQRVLLRYCLLAAHVAKKEGGTVADLRTILEDERSFEPLAALASQPNKVTGDCETALGLRSQYHVDAYSIGWFAITNGHMACPEIGFVIARSTLEATREGHTLYDGKCAMHRVDALRPLYKHAVQICATDENLFARTLQDD